MIPAPKPGIYFDVPHDVYRQWDAMNYSRLKQIAESVDLYMEAQRYPAEASDAMVLGSIVDAFICDPESVASDFAVLPKCDRRTTIGRTAYAAAIDAAGSATLVDESDMEKAKAIAAAIRAHKVAATWLAGGKFQVCIVWKDPETGALLKIRLDHWAEKDHAIHELKTACDAGHEGFANAVYNLAYDIQAAMAVDAVKAALDRSATFGWIAAETSSPFRVRSYEPSPEVLKVGRARYRTALWKMNECATTGNWRDPQCVEVLQYSSWRLSQHGVSLPMEEGQW
jgi:hypothetical protein